MGWIWAMGRMLPFKDMCLVAKLIRGGLVMVNLNCQLEWTEKY
jgi:hypothetical protein